MPPPLLIIGAGISGLTLAQACRKRSIPYRIFERSPNASHRSAGWGLTLNWSLPTFKSLLPDDIVARLPETYVNKAAVDAGEKGSFTFFNLSTGEAKWNVPASERIRVSRERLRKLMLEGVEVEWGKILIDVVRTKDGVSAIFSDESQVEGSFLIACDGANSTVRKLCHPDSYENTQLPVRFIGAGVHYNHAQISDMLKLDPYFLQGSDPKTNCFLWFSFLDTPSDPGGQQDDYYCQIMTSWPHRSSFLSHGAPTDVPETKSEQLSMMKFLAADWAEPFRSIVQNIPDESEVMPIHLADWLPRRTPPAAFAKYGGRVLLVGDAAHTMVMFQGEGANHAIVDVDMLLKRLMPLLEDRKDDKEELGEEGVLDDEEVKKATEAYEVEMIKRTEVAVLASRQACIDANDWSRLNEKSPLVRRRLMRADLEETEQARQ